MGKRSNIKKTLASGKNGLKNRLSECKDTLKPVRPGAVDAILFSDEESFRALAENIPDQIMRFDRNLRLLYANSAVLRHTGLPEESLIGRTAREYGASPEAADRWEKVAREVIQSGKPQRYEHKSLWHGETRVLDAQIVPERDSNGEVRTVIAIASDITERKRLEEEIQRLSKFPSENPNPILRISKEGTVLYANRPSRPLMHLWNTEVGAVVSCDMQRLIAEIFVGRDQRSIEIECKGRTFSIQFVPIMEAGYVNLYGRDVTTRKRAEEELRESEERFKAIAELTPVGIGIVAIPDGKFLYVNSTYQKTFGYSKDELLENAAPDIYWDKTDRDRIIKLLKDNNNIAEYEVMLKKKDGTSFWARSSARPICFGGKPALIGAFVDITKMKKQEKELQQFNRTLKAHSKSSQAMMRAQDEKQYLNEVCKIITEDCGHAMVWIGFAENDDGKTVWPVASAGFDEGYIEQLDITWADTERGRGPTGTAIRTGKPSGCRNMFTDPNFKPWREEALRRGYATSLVLPLLTGKQAFGAINIYSKEPDSFTEHEVTLLTDLADDVAYGIMAIRLQKAHTLAEETVRKERNFSNAVIQTTGGLIIGLDPKGRVQLFNNACEKTTGYTFDELKSKPFWDYLLLPEEMDAVKAVFNGIKDGKITAESEFENYWVAKDKSRRFIRWANSALLDANGNVELIIGTGIDVTEDKLNQARIDELNTFLMQRTTDLLAANTELEAFSYSVSHDLRSPLRAIMGFCSILLENYSDKLNANGQEFLNRIKSGADKMNRLIDDMLSLAKISRDEMDPKEIDLSAVAGSIVSELRHAEPERKVEAVIAAGLKAYGDSRLMHIALSNLIGNAWKYSSKTPEAIIEVGALEEHGEKVFYVRDNGAGFDMAHAKKLFAPFQRLHSDSQFSGIGIGLAIVNKVIQRHDGRIWGESQVGKGATFYFTLSLDRP